VNVPFEHVQCLTPTELKPHCVSQSLLQVVPAEVDAQVVVQAVAGLSQLKSCGVESTSAGNVFGSSGGSPASAVQPANAGTNALTSSATRSRAKTATRGLVRRSSTEKSAFRGTAQ
jgi:hypothetical protein